MFFEALLTHIGKLGLDLAAHLPEGVFGNANPIGLGHPLQPGRDVDAVAEDVVTLDQHIAKVDADTPFHSPVAGKRGVPLRRQALQRQGAFDGAHHRGELDQHTVARCLEDPPAALGNDRIGRDPMVTHRLRRARFIEPHQPAVANDISREDGG